MLRLARPGATFLLNSPYDADDGLGLPAAQRSGNHYRQAFAFYVVDAYALAAEVRLGRRINTIMQTCFFA